MINFYKFFYFLIFFNLILNSFDLKEIFQDINYYNKIFEDARKEMEKRPKYTTFFVKREKVNFLENYVVKNFIPNFVEQDDIKIFKTEEFFITIDKNLDNQNYKFKMEIDENSFKIENSFEESKGNKYREKRSEDFLDKNPDLEKIKIEINQDQRDKEENRKTLIISIPLKISIKKVFKNIYNYFFG